MSTYPGEQPPSDDGSDTESDTEPTQPVGYWERQAAEQAREQQGPPADPTTPYPQGSGAPDSVPPSGTPSGSAGGATAFNPTSGQPSPEMPSSPPYGQQPYAGQPYAQQPYAQQPYAGQPYAGQPGAYGYPPTPGGVPGQHPYAAFSPVPPAHPQSTLALVLGLIGVVGAFFACGLTLLVSPFAWGVGRNSLREIRASQGQLGGESNARTGMILGIVGTVLLVLAIVAIVVLIVVLALSDGPDYSGGSTV